MVGGLEDAEMVWDSPPDHRQRYGILPPDHRFDIARIEAAAGMFMIDVDYKSSHYAHIEEQKSSPYELGLAMVDSWRAIYRPALRAEKLHGSEWAFVGLHGLGEAEKLCGR
ncbi:MAG: hypothetical protein H6669_01460 [Ardenticatenaceae bacterium]|nr:hypothetical protein [Ardenticatenaceae bacterium]